MLLPTSTSLGTVWKYVERFRGSDDPAADLQRRFRAMDRLGADRRLVPQRPGWEPLKVFLDLPS